MIRTRLIIALSAVALLVLPTAASAGASVDRATGGGQILVSTEGGPGSTIAFTAQGTETDAKGQIQFIDRSAGTGRDQVRAHYVVNCIVVDGNMAFIGAEERNSGEAITLFVQDNGEGMMAEDDVIAIGAPGEGSCGAQDEEDRTDMGLARGNAKVYDADA